MSDPNLAERDRLVVELRRAGLSFAAIAARVGMASKQAAHAAHARATAGEAPTDTTEARAGELDRLDRLQVTVWGPALRGDLRAVDRVLRIMDARARLLGLDAPLATAGADEPVTPAPEVSPVDALARRRAARRSRMPEAPQT